MTRETRDTISTSELVRNLPAAIDQVRLNRRPLAITRGRRTVAALIPPPRDGYPVSKLAELLESLPKLGEDAADMADDLARIRRHALIPDSPWDS